jgi:hypothetical protein
MCETLKTLVSIAQVGGVLVAISALWWQIRRARLATNVELALRFDEKFNREDFRKLRADAAQELKKGSPSKKAEDIFDLFETIGYLVRTSAIRKELAWHTFYEWVHGYWSIGNPQIMKSRHEKKDPKRWSDFEYLHKELLKVQRSESSPGEPELLSPEEIDEFLRDEGP